MLLRVRVCVAVIVCYIMTMGVVCVVRVGVGGCVGGGRRTTPRTTATLRKNVHTQHDGSSGSLNGHDDTLTHAPSSTPSHSHSHSPTSPHTIYPVSPFSVYNFKASTLYYFVCEHKHARPTTCVTFASTVLEISTNCATEAIEAITHTALTIAPLVEAGTFERM